MEGCIISAVGYHQPRMPKNGVCEVVNITQTKYMKKHKALALLLSFGLFLGCSDLSNNQTASSSTLLPNNLKIGLDHNEIVVAYMQQNGIIEDFKIDDVNALVAKKYGKLSSIYENENFRKVVDKMSVEKNSYIKVKGGITSMNTDFFEDIDIPQNLIDHYYKIAEISSPFINDTTGMWDILNGYYKTIDRVNLDEKIVISIMVFGDVLYQSTGLWSSQQVTDKTNSNKDQVQIVWGWVGLADAIGGGTTAFFSTNSGWDYAGDIIVGAASTSLLAIIGAKV